MNRNVQIFISMLFVLSVTVPAKDVGRGGMAGSFLRMGMGARTLGMGGGSAALADDAHTVYYNPAGLVYLKHTYVTAALHNMALDRYLMYVGLAQSIGSESVRKPGMLRGGFGLGWLSSGVSNIDSRDENGVHEGMLSHGEHCFYFSFALNPDPKFALGVSGKLVYNRFPGLTKDEGAFSTHGFGFDLGLIVKPVDAITLGATLRDIRSRYSWDSQDVYDQGRSVTDHFPNVFQIGMVWRAFSENLLVHADYEKVEAMPGKGLFGAEYVLISGFLLRAGVEGQQPAFGLGYRGRILSRGFQLDYAYVPDPVAPRSNHIMACSFYF